MRLLLDTHILLWALTDDARLPERARELLLDSHNEVFFSAASVWEIAIKRTLRRETLSISAEEAARFFRAAGYEELAVSSTHAAKVENLPPIHADPFDRLLIAQALEQQIAMVSRDPLIEAYGVARIW